MYPATRQALIRAAAVFIPSVVALLLLLRGAVIVDRGTALTVGGIALGLGVLMMILLTIVERGSSSVVWSTAFLSAAMLGFFMFGWMMYAQHLWLALGGGTLLLALVAAVTAEVTARRRAPLQRP
jgi:hypothetical protein